MGSAKSDEGAEEALRESEERFRQVVSTTPDAVMIFDVETREFIEVNGACEKLYGYTREEFLALRHNDITAEQAESDDSIHRTRKGELDHIPVHYHRKKDGTVFPVEISGSSFTSGGRKVLCGVVRDITRHVEADRALRESEEKYRSLVETSQDLIWQCDGAGRFTYLNPAWEQVTGRKLDEMLGRRFTDFQTPEIAARDV